MQCICVLRVHITRALAQDFVPALYPSLFSSKHLDFLMTEVLPVMQKDRCDV